MQKRLTGLIVGNSAVRRYGIALVACGFALFVKTTLHGISPNAVPVFFLAMTVSAFFGGRAPGILAAAICSLSNLYFFVPPVRSFAITSAEGFIQFAVFTIGALIISSLTGKLYEESERARKAKERALAYVEQKEHFIANMSHEIRTPVSAVIGLAKILEGLDDLPENARAYVTKLQDSSAALLDVVNDVLDFSKLQKGKVHIEETGFSLQDVMRRSLSVVEQTALAKGLELRSSIDEDLPAFVKGDPARISQILINLLANAVKFTDRGAIQLSVTIERRERPEVKFEVTDSGIGIETKAQEKIFDAFFQADASTTRRYGGTGLGLSICQRLTHLMQGRIGMKSQIGVGSTFWFTVPLRFHDRQIEEPATATDQKKIRTNLNVLVSDDVEINRLIVAKLLEEIGCRVRLAENGKEAVDFVRREKFDLVFLDCHMPVMNGYDAAREIRALDSDSRSFIPIVALTAFQSPEHRGRCLAAGMNDYLTKPVGRDDLRAVIRRYYGEDFDSVDVEYLRGLSRQLGDKTTLRELLKTFASSGHRRVQDLEKACRAKDCVAIAGAAHALRSASRTAGAARLAKLVEPLEQRAENKESADFESALPEIKSEFLVTKSQLSELLRSEFAIDSISTKTSSLQELEHP